MLQPADVARAMHGLIDPLHSVLYFADEAREEYSALGLEPLAQGYVAGRSAPLGRAGPEVVAATFYNFNPALIRMGVPAAWDIASPEDVIAARSRAMERLYERIGAPTDGLAEATEIVVEAGEHADMQGRPLAAANGAVPLPGTPFADLFQALTVLREHRGDGHVALLISHGVGPVEALVLYTGWQDTVSRRFYQRSRLWDDDAWAAGEQAARDHGWFGDEGLTADGKAFRDELERRTDELAAAPYLGIGEARSRRLFELLRPLTVHLDRAGVFKASLDIPSADALG